MGMSKLCDSLKLIMPSNHGPEIRLFRRIAGLSISRIVDMWRALTPCLQLQSSVTRSGSRETNDTEDYALGIANPPYACLDELHANSFKRKLFFGDPCSFRKCSIIPALLFPNIPFFSVI